MAEKRKILIIDDEVGVRRSLSFALMKDYEILEAESGSEGMNLVANADPDLVLLDIMMPVTDGIEVLRQIKTANPNLPVIILTAIKTVKSAVKAMKLGAEDYLTKPFNVDELRICVAKVLESSSLRDEVRTLRTELKHRFDPKNLVGRSGAMQDIVKTIKRVADNDAIVLIQGESGTGKEVVAKAIHFHSPRSNRPWVPINCSAIPETLIESELFGHEKGSFTGAVDRNIGRFEAGKDGTVFLDEIGDLSPAVQVKLLRVLQEREFSRIGSNKTVKLLARLILATNKDLEKAVREGTFREDLFYRINVVPITIPPLRERREDIPLLIKHFLESKPDKSEGIEFNEKAMDLLMAYDWPGNVRELENVVERVCTLASDSEIGPEDLPENLRKSSGFGGMKEAVLAGKIPFSEATREIESEIILGALRKTNFVQTKAANLLGISRRILKYKMDKLGISEDDQQP